MPAQLPQGMERHQSGRFTIAAEPRDAGLAESLLRSAIATDTFPWLPRPTAPVLIIIAPDYRRFRDLVGPQAPEYGAAIAFPEERRVVMQGSRASSDAGDPVRVLRHELAHVALHERLGDLPPRWFDEGYAAVAAAEWGREEVLSTNVLLALRGMPTLDQLEERFAGGSAQASAAYALSYRAVVELAALDPERGLSLFFDYWRSTGDFDSAIRRSFGMTEADFERRWRDRTRRRYGALALCADLSLGALVVLVFTGPLYLARRRRDRERLSQMVRGEQEVERRERESAIEELLRGISWSLGNTHAPQSRDVPGAPPSRDSEAADSEGRASQSERAEDDSIKKSPPTPDDGEAPG